MRIARRAAVYTVAVMPSSSSALSSKATTVVAAAQEYSKSNLRKKRQFMSVAVPLELPLPSVLRKQVDHFWRETSLALGGESSVLAFLSCG